MGSNELGAISRIIAIAGVIIILFLLYLFIIKPAINSVELWWYLGYGMWFFIGIAIGALVVALLAIRLTSR